MIHLDTNVLIALPQWTRQGHPLITRIERGEPVAVCALVWYEFCSGPLLAEELQLAFALLSRRITPITQADAELAAHLFNCVGRQRRLRADTLIAACAINASAELVTLNIEDFAVFVGEGLRLAA